MNNKFNFPFNMVSLAVAILVAQPGFAQPAESRGVLEEVLVTAQRRSQSLQEVPIAVTALGADQLDTQQIDTPLEIANAVPNLQILPISAGGSAIQVHMRGASVQNPGFNTSESPVGIYLDDVYMGRLAGANLEFNDVERVEVLRGPQGTLYGRNTIAGALKFQTRRPGGEDWTTATASYGEFDTTKLAFSAGRDLVDDSMAASIALLYTDRGDGWQDNPTTGGSAGEYENYALRSKLRYYGSEDFEATLQFWFADGENDGLNFVPYAPFVGPGATPGSPIAGPVSTLSTFPSFGNSTQWGVSSDLSYDLSDSLTLRSITAFTDTDDNFGFDLAGGGVDIGPGIGLPFPFYVDGLHAVSDSDNQTFSQELQLLGKPSDSLNWIAGVYYLREKGNQVYNGSLSAIGLGFTETSSNDTSSYSIFAEASYRLAERLSLVFGGRYTRDDKEYDLVCNVNSDAFFGCAPSSGASVNLSDDWGETTWKLGLNWQISDTSIAYASYSEGFQAGGFQTLCLGDTICAGEIYDPQTVQSYEVGYKADLLDQTLRFNAAFFLARYDDIQQLFVAQSGFPTGNVGAVDVRGFEAELTWRPIPGLTIFTNVGLMSDEYQSLRPGSLTTLDSDLPNTPDLTYRLGFDHEIGVAENLVVRYGADYSYADSYFSESTNALQIDETKRANAFISLGDAGGAWNVELAGKNITDETLPVSGIYQPGFANVRTLLPTREWILTYTRNF